MSTYTLELLIAAHNSVGCDRTNDHLMDHRWWEIRERLNLSRIGPLTERRLALVR